MELLIWDQSVGFFGLGSGLFCFGTRRKKGYSV